MNTSNASSLPIHIYPYTRHTLLLNLLSKIHILFNFSQVSGKLPPSYSLINGQIKTICLKSCSAEINRKTFTDVAQCQDFMLAQRQYLNTLCLLAMTIDWEDSETFYYFQEIFTFYSCGKSFYAFL